MELINIEDISVKMTLWDRIFNGGVGTIELYSKTDRTSQGGIALLEGIEDPKANYDIIRKTRDKVRTSRALIS